MRGAAEYSLGDSDLAAERLTLVARIFDPAARAFLKRSAPRRPRLALDLGCGPGHSSEVVAEVTAPERIVGLDSSESFLEYARRRVDSRIELVCHDVRAVPFPARPADLIFARLLLSHLPEPERAVARWVGELAPDGVFLSDEVERIETRLEQFARYLALTERRIGMAGGDLYVGPRLAALVEGEGFRRCSGDAVQVSPATGEVAAMFRLNLRAMRGQGRLDGFAPPAELERIERELDELTRSTARGEIVWTLRQSVFAAC